MSRLGIVSFGSRTFTTIFASGNDSMIEATLPAKIGFFERCVFSGPFR